jgi:hypothetical protein
VVKNPQKPVKTPAFFEKIPPPAAPVTIDHILNTIYQRLNEGLQTILLSGNINTTKYHPDLSGFRNFDILFFIFDMT